MFGANPQRLPEWVFSGTYWIQEIFRTIQGEGPDVGTPAIFIRFAGCNLKCYFCDTDFESSKWRPTTDEIIQRVLTLAEQNIKLVVLTGGEPLRQPVNPLIIQLVKHGFQVQVETAGTLWQPDFDQCFTPTKFQQEFPIANSIIVSPKTPHLHPRILGYIKAFKYIVAEGETSADDGLPISNTQPNGSWNSVLHRPPDDFSKKFIFIQPRDEDYGTGCRERITEANQRHAVNICQQFGYRLSLQTHKILGLP